MRKVRNFLYNMKKEYRESNRSRSDRFVDIVTGRGVHSWRHYSVIKDDVENFLERQGYSFEWDHEGGRVKIDLFYSDV
ncbi:hypothetical protein Btru_060699 [Bulinus truncatus]|nr:hypothetical protein Btru_060699 [Bulinus truncatus]